jgi:chemotaxis protein histidine kinase CheA
MNAGLLDFFILEASEHVEHLDGLISRAESTPDLDAFSRHARAIRGSATMAKVGGIAELASSLESIVRGLRDGTVMWSVELKAALIAAVDDLKILIRGVRKWGADESDRATMRTFELSGFAPAFKRRQSMATAVVGSSSAGFLAAETADVAAGLARFADSCGPIAGHEDLIGRLRALRGVAALNDLPPLAEVIAVVDEAAKSLEISRTAPTTAQRNLLITASAVLREGSDALHAGGKPDSSSSAVQAFATAAAIRIEGATDHDNIVPISSLFPDDAGPHLLQASANPPTTPAQRFRMEVVSQAEHLRRLLADVRLAHDVPTRQRLGHELRGSVRALGRAAESFGETTIAMTMQTLMEGASMLEGRALGLLEQASALLTNSSDEPLAEQFAQLLAGRPLQQIAAPIAPPIAPPIVEEQSAPRVAALSDTTEMRQPTIPSMAVPAFPPSAAPSGANLHSLLGLGIAGLSSLESEPLSEPAEFDDDGIVAIQELLYRGPAALKRARELSASLKQAAAPDPEALAELYDLLELAAAE